MDDFKVRPEWMVLGWRSIDDGRYVVAISDRLYEAAIKAHYRDLNEDVPWPGSALSRDVFDHITITAKTERAGSPDRPVLWMFWGDSYAEAMAKAMANWSPPERAELTP